MLKKILSFIIFAMVVFLAYLWLRTIGFSSKQIQYDAVAKTILDDSIANHLADAIKIKTISNEDVNKLDSAAFEALHKYLSETYPITHQQLTKKTINNYSAVYHWEGKNPSLAPAVFVAHLDVVPVPDEELTEWQVAPFSGIIQDEIIWGRGAIDDKVSIIGILEATELLLQVGYQPERSIYLAFGHDEEVGGLMGAQEIVRHLKTEGVRPEFVLDEGYSITQGLVPGVLTDVALIGIAEKGFASLKLSVELDGGHSSMPGSETAIEVIANAIVELEAMPFEATLSEPVKQFIRHVGPEMRFQEKLVFANSNLFESIILSIYQQSPQGRAVVQTTMAPTVFNSGIKENVIPSSASATINFRVLPGSTIDDVIDHIKQVINDERISVKLMDFHSEPSKVSSTNSPGYAIINQSIKEIYPHVITVPNLVIAATDGRYYGEICENVYRFLPIKLTPDNINTMHGIDERIPVEEFLDAVRFYIQLIKNCG